MRIGYARVSTRDQRPETQHDAPSAAGFNNIFVDKASGQLAPLPELDKALLWANRPGDQLVFTRLDRLGRRLSTRSSYPSCFRSAGSTLGVLDQGIDASTASRGSRPHQNLA
jgi:DNA invertase Pin-like site-specific DNA recombinase